MTSTEASTERLAILFVDDEAKARKYFAKAFDRSYQMFCAESVDEAINLLEAHTDTLAVLVTDQRMPNQTGIDLVKYAKRNHPHIIRILTTAYADLADAIASVNEGEVYRYIRKPWDFDHLQGEIERATTLYLKQREERQIIVQKREVMYRVASNIAHELRTPLTGLAASADGIGLDIDKLLTAYEQAEKARLPIPRVEKSRRNMIGRVMAGIKAQVERAHNIIDMLLVSARPKAEGALETISISECVQQAIETYPVSEGQKECVRFTAKEDFCFLGVRVLAIHVFYNLIKNSLYAINGGGHRGEIVIEASRDRNVGELRFRDNGIGVSPEQMPYIFNEFFTTKLESSNNGVGLAFCRRTLGAWNASIHCCSVVGEYTEFALRFPIALAEADVDAIQGNGAPERITTE